MGRRRQFPKSYSLNLNLRTIDPPSRLWGHDANASPHDRVAMSSQRPLRCSTLEQTSYHSGFSRIDVFDMARRTSRTHVRIVTSLSGPHSRCAVTSAREFDFSQRLDTRRRHTRANDATRTRRRFVPSKWPLDSHTKFRTRFSHRQFAREIRTRVPRPRHARISRKRLGNSLSGPRAIIWVNRRCVSVGNVVFQN